MMLTKHTVRKSIANLRDSFTIDALIERLIVVEKIEESLKQSEQGKTVSNDAVKSRIDTWSR